VAGQPRHPRRARQDRTGQTRQPCRRLTVSHVHMASTVPCSRWRLPTAPLAPTAMGLARLRFLNAWPAWLASTALLPAQSLRHALPAPTETPLGLQRKSTATFAPLEAIAHSSQSRPRSVLLAHTSTRREAPRRSVVCLATPGTTVLQAAFYPHSALQVRSEQRKGVPSCPRVTPVPQASTVPSCRLWPPAACRARTERPSRPHRSRTAWRAQLGSFVRLPQPLRQTVLQEPTGAPLAAWTGSPVQHAPAATTARRPASTRSIALQGHTELWLEGPRPLTAWPALLAITALLQLPTQAVAQLGHTGQTSGRGRRATASHALTQTSVLSRPARPTPAPLAASGQPLVVPGKRIVLPAPLGASVLLPPVHL